MCKANKLDLNKIAQYIYKTLSDKNPGKTRITGKEIYDSLESIIGVNPAEINENKFKPIIKGIVDNNLDYFESKLGRVGGIYLRPAHPDCVEDHQFNIPESLKDCPIRRDLPISTKIVKEEMVIEVDNSSEAVAELANEIAQLPQQELKPNKEANLYLHDALWDPDKPVEGKYEGFKYIMKGRQPVKVKMANLETYLDEKQLESLLVNVFVAIPIDEKYLGTELESRATIECLGKKWFLSEVDIELFERIMIYCFDARKQF
jgi:hypothetical protein